MCHCPDFGLFNPQIKTNKWSEKQFDEICIIYANIEMEFEEDKLYNTENGKHGICKKCFLFTTVDKLFQQCVQYCAASRRH